MPAIDHLLKRLGFVRLARYGLVLTPEGRIMSLRPAVLDDGLGGRIVGWPDGDLAAMELQRWEPARPAASPAVANRVAVAPPPIPPRFDRIAAATPTAPVAPVAPVPVPTVTPVAPVVAQPAEVDEDEWEWEIALARARVAAEEVVQARSTIAPAIEPIDEWPRTEPLTSLDYEEHTNPSNEIVRAARLSERPVRPPTERPLAAPVGVRKRPTAQLPTVAPAPAPQPPAVVRTVARAGTTPPTIIPIPKLPSIRAQAERASQIQPVVRPQAVPQPRTRFAKGTGPIGTKVGVAPAPVMRPTTPANDDKTSPGITLPVAARPVALPSVKRAAR